MEHGMRTPRPIHTLALIAATLALLAPALVGAGPKRELPEKFRKYPYTVMSLSVGYPNSGWQRKAKKLRPLPYLKIKSGSGDNVYGHPALVLMLRRSARDVARAKPGSKMLVGDLSKKHGGPLSGHHSHQSGRDADIGFYALDAKGRKVLPERFISYGADGKARDGSGYTFDDHRNWLLVQSWARDTRAGLRHIFVARHLRKRLFDYAKKSKARAKYIPKVVALMKQPENASTHDDHFHVRIACPKRHEGLCHEESKR